VGPLNVRCGIKEPPSATFDWNQSLGLRNAQNHLNEGAAGNVLHFAKNYRYILNLYIYIYVYIYIILREEVIMLCSR
jgi:hypothetical protein